MIDILVVGGGIAGVSAAARLSGGASVLVLEAEAQLAHHASSRSAAAFEEPHGAPAVVALNRASRAELEAEGVLARRGLLVVARAEDADAFEADLGTEGMTEVGLAEARALWPVLGPGVARTAVHPDTFDLDADRLFQAFRREAVANGAVLRMRAAVDAIRRTATGWAVEAGGETHEAHLLVNAAGAWADRVATLAGLPPLGLVPHRRSMARVPAPVDPSTWPMVQGAGEAWYMKPDAGALLVSPAEEDPTEPHDAWAEDLVLAEGIARFEAHATLTVTRLLASWAGLRTFAPDRVPVLGPDPLDPAFLWCAGQGGYGFQTACAASRHLAELAGGTLPVLGADLSAALSPARLRD